MSEFSKEIKKKNLFLDSAGLSELFEKSYTYGSSDLDGEKIHLSAMNWIDKSGNLTVGRFGNLMHPPTFSPEYLERLKRNPGKLEVSNVIPEAGSSESPITNLGIGVDDEKEIYRGFINARVYSQTLLDSMTSLKTEVDVQVILLDQSAHVLGSSIILIAEDIKSAGEIVKKHISMVRRLMTAYLLKIKMAPPIASATFVMTQKFQLTFRCRLVSFSYNLSASLLGGLTPGIFLFLTENLNLLYGLGIYLAICGAVGLFSSYYLGKKRETQAFSLNSGGAVPLNHKQTLLTICKKKVF